MTGVEPLLETGEWAQVPDYGQVWYPPVAAGWVPYRSGHWAWASPWGWTWVDAAPWGFAPFHYGRWVEAGGRWGWIPAGAGGGEYGRPVYAPALVNWVGVAAGAAVGLAAGLAIGAAVGWIPLGPRETVPSLVSRQPRLFRPGQPRQRHEYHQHHQCHERQQFRQSRRRQLWHAVRGRRWSAPRRPMGGHDAADAGRRPTGNPGAGPADPGDPRGHPRRGAPVVACAGSSRQRRTAGCAGSRRARAQRRGRNPAAVARAGRRIVRYVAPQTGQPAAGATLHQTLPALATPGAGRPPPTTAAPPAGTDLSATHPPGPTPGNLSARPFSVTPGAPASVSTAPGPSITRPAQGAGTNEHSRQRATAPAGTGQPPPRPSTPPPQPYVAPPRTALPTVHTPTQTFQPERRVTPNFQPPPQRSAPPPQPPPPQHNEGSQRHACPAGHTHC